MPMITNDWLLNKLADMRRHDEEYVAKYGYRLRHGIVGDLIREILTARGVAFPEPLPNEHYEGFASDEQATIN